jgi:ring-1,2-phenylacetyl-CoA epoxidase subunit PaaD
VVSADTTLAALDRAWAILGEIQDPEIPVVSLVDLGIVRDVAVDGRAITVRMTPTFAGCPALHAMRQAVADGLRAAGFEPVHVEIVFDPPWSTDQLTPAAREKLRAFGLAPPPVPAEISVMHLDEPVECPHCGSLDTELRNAFGSTPCRTIRYCRGCRSPFEGFKPL